MPSRASWPGSERRLNLLPQGKQEIAATGRAARHERKPTRMIRHLSVRLKSLLRRERLEKELDVELQYHLDMLIDQNLKAGMSALEARRAALRVFGPISSIKDDVRDTWLSRFLETAAQDIRYGVRSLANSPGFTTRTTNWSIGYPMSRRFLSKPRWQPRCSRRSMQMRGHLQWQGGRLPTANRARPCEGRVWYRRRCTRADRPRVYRVCR